MSSLKDQFELEITSLHESLGISGHYTDTCGFPLQHETRNLCDCETDIFGRPQQATPDTFSCWQTMRSAAASAGINLYLVSAFRSVAYQGELIKRKLQAGLTIDEILKVNAAPGYSEHHTGRALDLSTDGCEPLSEEFEMTPAFHWLQENAQAHHFYLSFPRNNPFGIIYEPWHWACRR
jgi:D-alanyl-D-alanine carboxypeptidase